MPEQDRFHRFLTNNGRFRPEDTEYRRVYMLNVMLPTQTAILLFFYGATIFAVANPAVGAITALGAVATVFLLVYLHRTDAVQRVAHWNVCLLFAVVLLYSLDKGPRDYSYIYALLFPPVAYMMTGKRAGDRYVLAFVLSLGAIVGVTYHEWACAEHTIGTPVNLALAMLGMVVMMRFFEANRQAISERFQALNSQLRQSATIDSLTGVSNRARLEEVLRSEVRRQHRYAQPLSLLMVDLDRFKEVNDTHGHLVGDRVLVNVANLLRATMREADTIGRYGGEEFLVILPDTDRQQLEAAAARLMDAVPRNVTPPAGVVTYSVGGTTHRYGDTVEDLIRRADKAMYLAKQRGRNQAAFLWAEAAGDNGPQYSLDQVL